MTWKFQNAGDQNVPSVGPSPAFGYRPFPVFGHPQIQVEEELEKWKDLDQKGRTPAPPAARTPTPSGAPAARTSSRPAEEATQQSMKEVALVDALKASQAANEALEAEAVALVDALKASQTANDALEAVVKMQAEAMEKIMLERQKEREHLRQLMRKYKSLQVSMPKMSEAPTEIVDVAVQTSLQTVSEEDKEASQPQPKIQPPVAPAPSLSQGQAPLGSKLEDSAPPTNPRIQPPVATPTPENVEGTQQIIVDMDMANASPHVAEAFRLGWLAGVKSNTMAANRSPSSTRSDESPPSDPGSFVNVSASSEESGSDSGSATPQKGGVLPPLPALLPPQTPVLDIEQLG